MRTPVMLTWLGILAVGGGQAIAQNGGVIPPSARSVVVPANVPWTYTGIHVTRGQWLRFESSGEIRLSFNGDDVAVAAGARSGRMNPKAPIPSSSVGALIGRVNSGKPFSIGDAKQALQMPANGTLFLAVNDDHVPDNSGNYVVKVWELEN